MEMDTVGEPPTRKDGGASSTNFPPDPASEWTVGTSPPLLAAELEAAADLPVPRSRRSSDGYTSFPHPTPPSPGWSQSSVSAAPTVNRWPTATKGVSVDAAMQRSLELFQQVSDSPPVTLAAESTDRTVDESRGTSVTLSSTTLPDCAADKAPPIVTESPAKAQARSKARSLHAQDSAATLAVAPTPKPPSRAALAARQGAGARLYAPRVPFSRVGSSFGPYQLLRTLGQGEFGKVKLALHQQTGQEVAIKLIRKASLSQGVRRQKVRQEIAIMRRVQHPFIVQMYEVVETPEHIALLMEYASGGELFEHILSQRRLAEPAAARLFGQLLAGVDYLHRHGIVHRDLKLENLLLDSHGNLCITDFGFAFCEHTCDESGDSSDPDTARPSSATSSAAPSLHQRLLSTSCGSPCYAAPELVLADAYTGPPADVWSCGVILYSMLAGYLPFDDDPSNPDGENIGLLYRYIVTTPLSFPAHLSPPVRSLLQRILVPDPRRRAPLAEILAHPWLASARAGSLAAAVADAAAYKPSPPPSVLGTPAPGLPPSPSPSGIKRHETPSMARPSSRAQSMDVRPAVRAFALVPDTWDLSGTDLGPDAVDSSGAGRPSDGPLQSIRDERRSGDSDKISIVSAERQPNVGMAGRPTIDVPPYQYESLSRPTADPTGAAPAARGPHRQTDSMQRQTARKSFFAARLNRMINWLRGPEAPQTAAQTQELLNASVRPTQRPREFFGRVKPVCVMATDNPLALHADMERCMLQMGFDVECEVGTWRYKTRTQPPSRHGSRGGVFGRILSRIFGSGEPDSPSGSRPLITLPDTGTGGRGSTGRRSTARRSISITSNLKFTMELMQLPGQRHLYYVRCKRCRGDPWEFQRAYRFLVDHLSRQVSLRRPAA